MMKHMLIENYEILYEFQKLPMKIDQEDPCLIRCLKGHCESITTLDLHPSCKLIASAGMDNIILLWNLNKKTAPKKLIGHKSQIHDIKFSPNGSSLVSASNDQSLKFWDVDFEQSSKQTTLIKAHNARIRGLSFACDGLLLGSCGDDKLIKVWSTVDRRLQFSLKGHDNWVRHCEFSPSAVSMASCDDKFVYLWDLQRKKIAQSYKGHNGVIHKVTFHSQGNVLASCSHDKKIKLYDQRTQNLIQIYQGHKGPVKSIDFHPQSPYLISSSDDGTTKVWNSKKGKLQYTLQIHSNNTQFSRQGDYFVTGGSDKTLKVWKTGFYDSMNEHIIENDSISLTQSKRLIQVSLNKKEESRRDSTSKETTIIEFSKEEGKENQPQKTILYNHKEDNFQIQDKFILNPQTESESTVIPVSMIKKIRRISNQLNFINKTIQILEARVLNNGEQLNRLVQVLEL